MIEIIKRGLKQEVQCGNCDSILRFSESDVETEQVGNSMFGNGINNYIICPVCQRKIPLAEEIVYEI